MPENILVPGRKAISAVSSFSPGLFHNTLLKNLAVRLATTHKARALRYALLVISRAHFGAWYKQTGGT